MNLYSFWLAMTVFFIIEHVRTGLGLDYSLVPTLTISLMWCLEFIKKAIKHAFWPKERDLYLDDDEREIK
jgi:hypothetical protein